MNREKEKEFSELLLEHERFLVHLSMKYEGFNRDNAEDLLQDTKLKAFKHFETYVPTYKFSTWMGTIMRNTYIDKYRKSKDYTISPLETGNEEADVCNLIPNGEYDRMMDKIHFKELMDHAKATLSPRIMRPFELWIQNYSYKDMSKKLNMPEGTLKSYLNEAREKIKETFPR